MNIYVLKCMISPANLSRLSKAVGGNFLANKKTNIRTPPIVFTFPTKTIPQVTQKLRRHIFALVLRRVWATLFPVNPGQCSICILCSKFHVHKRWQIMFIWKTVVFAFHERWEVFSVRYEFKGKVSISLEPLRPFSPLIDCDSRVVTEFIPAASHSTGIVIDLDESLGGVHEVGVDSGEVVEGNACFWEQNKTLVWDVEKSICQEAALCLDQARLSPILLPANGTCCRTENTKKNWLHPHCGNYWELQFRNKLAFTI